MKKAFLLLCCVAVLPSCSVVMAAKKEGTDVSQIQASKTRGQILSLNPTINSSERLPTGELVETYTIQKEKGSTARAVMHGLLDLSTFCIWEIAGTPIEGSLNKKEFFSIKVTYNEDETIKKVELL